MAEAAQNTPLQESLSEEDRTRLALTQAAPWLQDTPVMKDGNGNDYMAGEGGSVWMDVPAAGIRPAKGLPKITPAPPADRASTRPPIVWRRKGGQLELIYGSIPEGAERVAVQIFDESKEQGADTARQTAYKQAVENIEPLTRIVEAAAKAVGGKAVMRPKNKENGLATKAPSTAFAKADRDYNGDISRVVDLIGGTCVLPESGSYADAVEAIRAALPAGCSIAKVKKLGFDKKNPCYQDVKASIRFANGGIGEVILVSEFMNDAKFNRGGHAVYELYRVLDPFRFKDGKIEAAVSALESLSSAIYSTEADSAAFARAKDLASSALQSLPLEALKARLSSNDMMVVKSSSSLLKEAKPLSVDSAAIPSSSDIKKDISNADIPENAEKVNHKKQKKTRLVDGKIKCDKEYLIGLGVDVQESDPKPRLLDALSAPLPEPDGSFFPRRVYRGGVGEEDVACN